MTLALPEPVPLEAPPGDPDAVDELVRDIAGAAFHLAGVGDRLRGPGAAVPGWVGDDAVAAAGQVGRVAGLAGTSAAAVLTAAGRLSTHAEVLRDTRRQVDALREQQDEDFRSAQLRLGDLEDPRLAVMTGGSGWAGVVAEVEAAEAERRRRHARLLDELADDAAATVRVLADATRPAGGAGRPGDDDRVLVHLAAELPGWGDPEMAGRGRALAVDLVDTSLPARERTTRAADTLVLAGHPAFATALIRGLGEAGVGHLLHLVGEDGLDGPGHPLARLLTAGLGAAIPAVGVPHDEVAAVLDAAYLRARDPADADATAIGMAAVLVAGGRTGGPPTATVAAWARQLLLREQVRGEASGMTVSAWGRPGEGGDPAAVAVGTLARRGDSGAAAALLGDRRVWEVLLERSWGDGGAALGDLIGAAAGAEGYARDDAVRTGLEAIGAGLLEGDPADRLVDRLNVAAVAPVLGRVVAADVHVVTDALTSAATQGGDASGHLLRGLGSVSVDREAAAVVEGALSSWVAVQPQDVAGSRNPLPAFVVPSAYLAVQEYGQRLAYALDGFDLQYEAERRARLWNLTFGAALEVAAFSRIPPVAIVAEAVKTVAPPLLGVDGSFDQGPDRGLRFAPAVAAANVAASLPPDSVARVDAARAQAEAAYLHTARLLGDPSPPSSLESWRLATDVVVPDAPRPRSPVR